MGWTSGEVVSLKPLRVLAVIEAASITGPAKNLIELAIYSRRLPRPVEFSIVTFRRPSDPPSDPFLDALKTHSIPHHILSETNPFDIRSVLQLNRLLSSIQPAVVQTHNVKSHLCAALLRLVKGFTWVAWHHGYTWPTLRQRLYNRVNFLTLRFAKRVVSVTSAFLPELATTGVPASRVCVIPNAIDADSFIGVPPYAVPAPPGSRILLAVGRLSQEKGHADLMEALSLLSKNFPAPLHLVLVGDGHERQALESLAQSRNLSVTFAGQVSDVRPFFAAAHLFVLPSHSEGSPNVLIEAMAAALPIVATDVGGIPETVTHRQQAILVPPASPPALAEAISLLLSDADLASTLATAARQQVLERFLPQSRATKVTTLYEQLL
jgi:glycosyltransferase involved in cell wall biosynthesis